MRQDPVGIECRKYLLIMTMKVSYRMKGNNGLLLQKLSHSWRSQWPIILIFYKIWQLFKESIFIIHILKNPMTLSCVLEFLIDEFWVLSLRLNIMYP